MSTKTGWLKDKNGKKFAPKTLSSRVIMSNGTNLQDTLDNLETGGGNANSVEITQAEYDALTTKDPDTVYFISDGIEDVSDVEVGNTYIGDVGDGTITGAISTLNTNSALKTESFIPRRTLTSADDLNTLYEPGIYSFATASIPQNSPFSNGSIVEVIPATDARIIQRVTRYGKAGQSAERVLFGSEWLDWTYIIHDASITHGGLTYVNGAEDHSDSQVYKIGNIVYLHVHIKIINGISARTKLILIPEGYRPQHNTRFVACGSTAINGTITNSCPGFIMPDGYLYIGDSLNNTVKELALDISYVAKYY